MAAQAKKMASKKAPGLRHPIICIDVALQGVAKGGISGLQAEYDSFEELMASDVSKSLVHVFLGQRAINKVTVETVYFFPLKAWSSIGLG